MLGATSTIITQFVVVRLVTPVIRLSDAFLKRVSPYPPVPPIRIYFYYSIYFIVEKPVLHEPENPCVPSPCGPNSQCRVVNSVPVCSCLPNYVGRAPNCRPECTIDAECPGNRACINEKCQDPCTGACGANTLCTVIKHSPVCSCQHGYTGDPFSGCTIIPSKILLVT